MKKIFGILAMLAVVSMTGSVYAATTNLTDSDGTALVIDAGGTADVADGDGDSWEKNTAGTIVYLDTAASDAAYGKGMVVGSTDDTLTTIKVGLGADAVDQSIIVDSTTKSAISIAGGATAGINITVQGDNDAAKVGTISGNGDTEDTSVIYIASTANGPVNVNVTAAAGAANDGHANLLADSIDKYVFVDKAGVDNTITITGTAGGANATVTGIVDMGGGTNTINLVNATADVVLTNMALTSTTDNDTVTIGLAANQALGEIDIANGNTGTTTTINMKNTAAATLTVAALTTGSTGSDILKLNNTGATNAGSVLTFGGNIDLQEGDNQLFITGDAQNFTVNGTIAGGTAADTLDVDAGAAGNVVVTNNIDLNAGTNIINADTASTGTLTFSGSIAGGADADTLTFTATGAGKVDVQNIDLKAGTNSLTMTAVAGDVEIGNYAATGATGTDDLVIKSTGAGVVTTGTIALGDTAANSVTVSTAAAGDANLGTITGGDAVDTLSFTAGSATTDAGDIDSGAIDVAAGNDSVTIALSGAGDFGAGGAVSIDLGTGDDTLTVTTGTGGGTVAINALTIDTGNDTVNVTVGKDATTDKVTITTLTHGAGTNSFNFSGQGITAEGMEITNNLDTTTASSTDTITLNNLLIDSNFTLGTGDKLIVSGNAAKIDGAIADGGAGISSTVEVAYNTGLELTGGVVLGNDATDTDKLVVGVGAANVSTVDTDGIVKVGGASTLGSGTAGSLTIDLAVTGDISTGDKFLVVGGDASVDANIATITIIDNSAVLSFADDGTDDAFITLVATRVAGGYTAAAGATVSENEGATLDTLSAVADTATGEVGDLCSTLDAMNAGELAQAAKELSPESVIGTVDAGVAAANAYVGGVMAHTATMRNNASAMKSAPMGPAGPTAAVMDGIGVWADTYGTWGDQDKRDGKMGYEWDTYGGVVGMDKVFGNTLVGLSFGYSETDVDADSFSESDIDTYNLGIYATHTIGALWIDGGFSYAWGDIETDRKVNFLNRVAKSDTESDTWTLYGGVGYDFVQGNWTLTPNATLKYSDYDQDDYTEKGALGANLRVDDFSQDSFTSTLGVDVAYQIQKNLKATFKAAWVHEYCDNQATLKASFAGAQTFKTEGLDPADDSGIFGVGLQGEVSEGITAYVDYSYELKDDFDAHNVTAGMRFDF